MASTSNDPVLKTEAVATAAGVGGGGEWPESGMVSDQLLVYRGMKKAKKERGCTAKERISKMPPCTGGKRSSIYRGVTRHRWTGRYEAHLWDKSTWNQNQNKKGKQVYLGAYDDEEAAARAYDLAALKYWGPATLINFPVTDYARDLEEMKNVSREEYLAFLRRKSSGFSRGISKYRGHSSGRWDRLSGPEYLSNLNYGRGNDVATESDVLGNFCIDRKIDLTSYIKWWGPNKARQADSSVKLSEETKPGSEEMSGELKTSECAAQTTEPYQMPRLGLSSQVKRHKGTSVSALNILSRSAAYKSLEEKASKNKEKIIELDENENKNVIIKDFGKAGEEEISHDRGGVRGGVPLGTSAGLQFQRNMYPLTHFLSAPLLSNYTTIDPLADPVLWSSLAPVLPVEPSHSSEVSRTESSSTYTFFHPDE